MIRYEIIAPAFLLCLNTLICNYSVVPELIPPILSIPGLS